MPIIAAVYLFCYFSKNHICSRLILSFLAKIFLDIQWGLNRCFPGWFLQNLNINSTINAVICTYVDNGTGEGNGFYPTIRTINVDNGFNIKFTPEHSGHLDFMWMAICR